MLLKNKDNGLQKFSIKTNIILHYVTNILFLASYLNIYTIYYFILILQFKK